MLTDAVNIALGRMGREVVRKSKRNLLVKKLRRTASGKRVTSKIDNTGELVRSLKYKVSRGTLKFEMAEYGEWVDEGRKPGKYAPPQVIEKWVKRKPVRLRDKQGRFMKQTPKAMKSLAFLINRGIHDYGIRPTKFFSKPFNFEFNKMGKRVPEAIDRNIKTIFK